jgi:hypothetical protein
MSHGGKGTLVMGSVGGGVLQCWRRKERVRCTPIESHDVRRAGSLRRRGCDADSGSDFRW